MKDLRESLSEKFDTVNEKLDLDDEMKLWRKRSEDEFGSELGKMTDCIRDYEVPYKDEYGITNYPSEMFQSLYALDGNRQQVAIKALRYLFQHDLVCPDTDYNFCVQDDNLTALAEIANNIARMGKLSDTAIATICR